MDILDMLVGFLCPTSDSATACHSFINTHKALGPMEPMLYFVFFPTVFIILFIYILSNSILRGGGIEKGGLRLLIAVAVYIFIIIRGWYPIFLPLAEVWFIVIIILGGLWYFIHSHFGGGGGPKGEMPGFMDRTAALRYKVVDDLLKMAHFKLSEEKDMLRFIDRSIRTINASKNALKRGDTQAWRAIHPLLSECNELLGKYRERISVFGFKVAPSKELEMKMKELENIIDEISKIERKEFKKAA